MNTKLTKLELYAYIAFGGLFITGSTLRNGIYSNLLLKQHSPLLLIGLLMLCLVRTKERDLSIQKFDRVGSLLYVLLIFSACSIFVIMGYFREKVMSFISVILPSIIVLYRFQNRQQFYKVFEIWMKLLKFCIILIVITGIIDILTSYSITHFFAEFTGISSYSRIASQDRCVSYMGHPLYTGEICLSYYLFSHMRAKMTGEKESIIDFTMALLGAVLAQGRTAVILLSVAYLIFNLKWKRLRYIVFGIILLWIGYKLHIFDSIIQRFIIAINNGDISAGRNSSLFELIRSGSLELFWFRGHEIYYDGSVTLLGMALEYPIVAWAYNYGIFITIILMMLVFIYPILIVSIRKQKDVLIALLFIILNVNSYSGISNNGYKPLHFYIMVCLLLNISKIFYKRNSKSKR